MELQKSQFFPRVLSCAGSDPSGGAGIQADLKTFEAFRCYGLAIPTVLTVQNTQGVSALYPLPLEALSAQLEALYQDIPLHALKIGLLPSPEAVACLAEAIKRFSISSVVLDPVLQSTSGFDFGGEDLIQALKEKLLSSLTLLTPNLPELLSLTGFLKEKPVSLSKSSILHLAQDLSQHYGCAVLVKGGHRDLKEEKEEEAEDLLVQGKEIEVFKQPWISSPTPFHGTGCTLSSAIAAGLAWGFPLSKAVYHAKAYITGALRAGLEREKLGKGDLCPLDHGWQRQSFF